MEGVNAQHHQHMFCARLDMAVDDDEGGKGLYVSEVSVLAFQHVCQSAFLPLSRFACERFLHLSVSCLCPLAHVLWRLNMAADVMQGAKAYMCLK